MLTMLTLLGMSGLSFSNGLGSGDESAMRMES